MVKHFLEAVAVFGASAKAKLDKTAIHGQPEEQLRSPIETLVRAVGALKSIPNGKLEVIGETAVADLKIRPDFAVVLEKVLIGFIEIKAPGKGCDPRRFKDKHDKDQWSKLKALPNLLYTDGNGFSLWQDGDLVAKVLFEEDVETAGSSIDTPAGLEALLGTFLDWKPIPPRNAKGLAAITARLCRLLRDEVTEQLQLGNKSLTALKLDWRKVLFPLAKDREFADGYAQAVTFGLLVARAQDIDLTSGIDAAAQKLRKSNSLIGTALRVLTDDVTNQEALKTSLGTLVRVLSGVDWHVVSRDKPEAWLYFYEEFLKVYDPLLRKRTGSYYTPPLVVDAMVRLTDEALQGPLFSRDGGLSNTDVIIADPAVGTGTFLLGVLKNISTKVGKDLGSGTAVSAVVQATSRLIGFEMQFGPFAVAQLRLIAELQSLISKDGETINQKIPDLRLYLTNTLGNPFDEEDWIPAVMEPIAASRRQANEIKKAQPIMVVIGNPPYKEKAQGLGGWIEKGPGGKLKAPLDWWQPPAEWNAGAHSKHLKNLYIFFWRWASWKVFGSGHKAATGLEPSDEEGIICYITAAGFLNGQGFQRMREDLRQSCSDIWVIDCSPEGHQPKVATRIFQGVQQPICIVLAARKKGSSAIDPARVHYQALPTGSRAAKFAALGKLSLYGEKWVDAEGWEDCSKDWRSSFLPEAEGVWADFMPLAEVFDYDGSGVMPGRTWVIAPDRETLQRRWDRLIAEEDDVEKEKLFHPHLRKGLPGDKHIRKSMKIPMANQFHPVEAIIYDKKSTVKPIRYAYRSLDRQWIIPDGRLINQPNPGLWESYSDTQIYLTAPESDPPKNGPAISFSAQIPDLHHYAGRGGRTYPLWANNLATNPNVKPCLLELLSDIYLFGVGADDVMAYLAAIMAHPDFTVKFAEDLRQPGLRFPLTADPLLFSEGADLGRRIIWLHTYGERNADPAVGRPKSAPRKTGGPTIVASGAIPGAPAPLPSSIEYDAGQQRLVIGDGFIDQVTPAMWEYEISGKSVIRQWFSNRRLDRVKPVMGDKRPPSPLQKIQPDHWLPEYTRDLMDLLHVLARLIDEEDTQADLLSRVLAGPLIDQSELFDVTSLENGGKAKAHDAAEASTT